MNEVQRIQYHRYGGPDVLRRESVEPPRPGAGQLLIRVVAAAANAMDWKIRGGQMRLMTGNSFPRGLGHDFAGVVEATGGGITRFTAGDAVLGATTLKAARTFAELVLADEKAVVKKSADLSYEQAAVLPIVATTAYQAILTRGKLQPGQAVFINGCLGGVGRAAAQIALMHGASAAGSCRATAAAEARRISIDPIVDFGFDPDTLRGRFDLVLDTAGTLSATGAKTLLKPGGRILDIVPSARKFARSALPGPYQVVVGRPVTEDLEAVARLAAQGIVSVPIARTVPLAEAIPALTELERHHTPTGGKLLISVS